ncbi:MAG TPA: NAD(P)-dependent alcohol dehydrogenase [Candidatus Acidoferrales bacterium]|jgi:NADPH:quinone reductase-like Zn-dependent oxidoreductase|nr:NAD(P)-dependent alcohol dehydrogenase [Candidatus Acidoferrales bacterium]
MKAIKQDTYGPIAILEERDIDKPAITESEVLIRVRAAAVHVGDVFGVKGSPFLMRAATGLRRPKYGVPGFDVAGDVVAIGATVTSFKVGDAVFGVGVGTCAEYTRASESKLAAKPAGLTYEQAAAIPTSAIAALQGLRDAGHVRAGQKVLIYGASGGVGTFAVQIAKALGADVTGVCGTPSVDLVRSIGADHVIDHTAVDFVASGARYDVIFDNVENRSLSDVRRALTPDGILVLNSGTGATGLRMFVRLLRPIVLSIFTRQKMRRFISSATSVDLAFLSGLVEAGKLRPVIDRTYPLEETPAALRRIEAGQSHGKVVVAVA